MTATVLNAYIGPVMVELSGAISTAQLKASATRNRCRSRNAAAARSRSTRRCESPLLTLDSGPVSGVTGSLFLGQLMGVPNIITTDMGGTSFDVGIIFGGRPSYSFVSQRRQYEYFLPKVDIQAIGSGGGSLARVDQSLANAHASAPTARAPIPGPVCYGKGGTVADGDRRRCRARLPSIRTTSSAGA